MKKKPGFTIEPYPRIRQLMVDGGKIGLKKHTVHGLFEFNITKARKSMQEYRIRSRESLSFSAYFLSCLGKAIEQNKQVHAYRDWLNRLVIFDDVDVNMLFEVEIDGEKAIRPHILRAVNKLSAQEIQEEISEFQNQHQTSAESKFIDRFVVLPGFIRRFFLRYLFKRPQLIKEMYGTVIVSSIGMFGSGSGWAIPVPNHTLQITLGGVEKKPFVNGPNIEVGSFMSVTISFDHDIIDGAPAARFIHNLKTYVEKGLDN